MDLIRHSLVVFDVEERQRIAAQQRLILACAHGRPRFGITARIGTWLIAVGGRLEASARTRESLSRSWAEEPTWH
jgi:hypothetical protein